MRTLDDFTVGEVFETREASLTKDQIKAFAADYDPQRIHLDETYAADGPFGGLIASGFQTLGLAFRLFLDLGHLEGTSLGGPGLDEVRWTRPLRPEVPVKCRVEVLEVRPSRSKPDRGLLRFAFTMTDAEGETVLTFKSMSLVARRR